MPSLLNPLVSDPDEVTGSAEDDGAPDEGVIVDGLGIPRVAFRCWTERTADPFGGGFLMLHHAVVWDKRGVEMVARPAPSREAALNEALGLYLATAGNPRTSGARRG